MGDGGGRGRIAKVQTGRHPVNRQKSHSGACQNWHAPEVRYFAVKTTFPSTTVIRTFAC
jgi:hypothetical protein